MKLKLAWILLALAGAAVAPVRASADGAPDLTAGRVLYDTYCARCHGMDGRDTTLYPGIKSLENVTRRFSRAEVVEKSRGFAAVQLDEAQAAALVAHLATFVTAEPAGYGAPELLVETGWLAEHGKDAGVRIVDLRPPAAYAAGHVPGAVQIADSALRNAEDKETYLPGPEAFAALMGKAGVTNRTHVVLYDQDGRAAARLWYVLNAYGHPNVSLLNGGWPKWSAESRPASTEVPAVEATTYTPKQTPLLGCPSTEVLARKPGVVFLDTRSAREYQGGRLPGAVNVEWKENLVEAGTTFKPAAELRKLYAGKGLTPDKEIVTYCASGGRASVSLFALKLLGYPKVRVYYGSYSDYTARPGAPVEK
jgi:thiosulfate/3-mercaptopyruvate sulfurtransferase